MRGRPNVFDQKEIVLKAQEIFWEKGYNATSLSDLSNGTGAGAGSIYNAFRGGKKELFKKSLSQRREVLNSFKNRLESSNNPVQLIKEYFLEIAFSCYKSHKKGCIVANTIVEMPFIDEELEIDAIEILKDTERLFINAILTEQGNGTLKSKIPAEVLAKYLITIWCGINSLRRIYPSKVVLEEQIELQLRILS